jgi:hypothetical protein
MMHFEILIEDQAGKKALEILVPKLMRKGNTFHIHSYKGIGHIPKGINPKTDANKRILLDRLPRLLRGFGKTFYGYGANYKAAVIVVCDLDDKDKNTFLSELEALLNQCDNRPETRFCLAIEEGEAWLLGDIPAIRQAFPNAKMNILNSYVNDAICGTWELLADAVYPNGHEALTKKGWQAIGAEKSKWAETISPYMDVDNNQSPSFNYFKKALSPLPRS